MGEIADMMLDGTMDCETGEWNFDGMDGPGWPMTGAEARAYEGRVYKRATGERGGGTPGHAQAPEYKLSKGLRGRLEKHGKVQANDRFHWQVRDRATNRVLADWWPHKGQYRFPGEKMQRGEDNLFAHELYVRTKPLATQP